MCNFANFLGKCKRFVEFPADTIYVITHVNYYKLSLHDPLTSCMQELDPTFVPKSDQLPEHLPRSRPLTAEDYKIALGVERFRCPEVLFQPSMVGVDQAGLNEMAAISLNRLSARADIDESVKDRIAISILVTGGSSLFPGLVPRLEALIRQSRPYLSPLKVVRASDPVLDAWRGAAIYADSRGFSLQTFSMQDYYEQGEAGLRRHNIVYSLY